MQRTAHDWMRPVDSDILASVAESEPEYLPIVANRLGIHLDYAEQRCDVLVEHDLIEQVTGEALYRVTDHGEHLLDELRAPTIDQ